MARLDLIVDVTTKGAGKLDNLVGTFAKAGVAVTGAAAGFAAVTAGFASDLNESMSKVGVVFDDSADQIVKWSETSAEAMGISQQQALESAGTFGNLFDSMGIAEDASADMSTELVALASDLASFNNIDPTVALEKLRAGLVGEAEPLRTLGVNISAAATEAKAMELGLVGLGEELTAADKAAANYAIIMEQTSNAQGDFARTSDGMANQQRILAATFNDSMAQIGQAFVPIIQQLLPGITAGIKGFADLVTAALPTIQTIVGTVFGFIQKIIGGASGRVSQLQGIFGGIIEFVKANLPTISSIAGQVFGAVGNIIKVLAPILIEIAKVLLPAIGTAATVAFKVLDVAFKGIGGAVEVLGNVFDTVFGFISDLVGGIVGAIKGVYNAFARVWNSIEISVPSVDIPFVGKVGGFSIGLPDLPMLASGGIVTDPTLAILGEKGPEAVIPLDQMQGNQTVIEVTVLGDLKAEDEKSLADAIGRVWWANGFSDQVLTGG